MVVEIHTRIGNRRKLKKEKQFSMKNIKDRTKLKVEIQLTETK